MDRFTQAASRAMERGVAMAGALGHTYVGTEHLLLGVLSEKGAVGARLLLARGVTLSATDSLLRSLIGTGIPTRVDVSDLTPKATRVLSHASTRAGGKIGTEHILMGILIEEDCCGVKLIEGQGVKARELLREIERYLARILPEHEQKDDRSSPELDAIAPYVVDLNEKARKGALDPLIGREREMESLVRILCRRQKCNPCIVGLPGVGKTALCEGLAGKIEAGTVPPLLAERRILALDLPALLAGAKYRGEFEERMKKVMAAAKKHPDIIFFLDEIHTLVGAGGAEGAIDAANILKPALARGEMRIIGATTPEEYRQKVEKDAALCRRLVPVHLGEPGVAQTAAILRGLREGLEQHHGVTVDDAVIDLAIDCSTRYLPTRCQPDKAIDLLDEACSAAAMHQREVDRDLLLALACEKAGMPPVSDEDEMRRRIETAILRQMPDCAAAQQLGRVIARTHGEMGDEKALCAILLCRTERAQARNVARGVACALLSGGRRERYFDLAALRGEMGRASLLGSAPGYVGHEKSGALATAVRSQPYGVLFFDSLDRADETMVSLVLSMLEDGYVTDAAGGVVDLRSSILLFGCEETGGNAVGFAPEEGDVIRHRLPKALFDHFDACVSLSCAKQNSREVIKQ